MKNFDWYNSLKRPKFSPTKKVFKPVWVILYILMGISLILFLLSPVNLPKIIPIIVFFVQLFLNLIWTTVFFKFKNMGFALFINCLLLVSVLSLIILFYPFSKLAGLLFIPYLLWNSFAIYLNFEYLRLNKG